MKKAILLSLICLFQTILSATGKKPDQESASLWKDGKITPEQPFEARIVAAGGLSPWSGEIVIYLREEGGHGRYLSARVGVVTGSGIQYKELSKADFDEILKWKGDSSAYNACVYITPVEVSRFVYVSPLGDVGAKLGDTDIVKKVYLSSLQQKVEKPADQPAAAPDSKSEGKDESKPESEARPR